MPTIGKTTLAKNNSNIIDLDSLMFNEVRDNPNWIYSYCKVALYLESKGYIVLVSFNPKIHPYLKENAQQYLMIAYDWELKDYCIDKIKARYNSDPENQSARTLDWIITHFDEILKKSIKIAAQYNIDLILINNSDYDLATIIKEYNKKGLI